MQTSRLAGVLYVRARLDPLNASSACGVFRACLDSSTVLHPELLDVEHDSRCAPERGHRTVERLA